MAILIPDACKTRFATYLCNHSVGVAGMEGSNEYFAIYPTTLAMPTDAVDFVTNFNLYYNQYLYTATGVGGYPWTASGNTMTFDTTQVGQYITPQVSGTAAWFALISSNGGSTAYNAIIGTIGESGSGMDMILGETAMVADITYNFRILEDLYFNIDITVS